MVRGVSVTGLIAGPEQVAGVPHVVGVLARDVALRADLVVDATGRRSAIPTLIQAVGGQRPADSRAESGFVYYARHFRTATGDGRPSATTTLLSHFDSVSLLTLPSDNDTWAVNIVTSSRDKQARALRDEQTWQRVLNLFPHQAPWTNGVPITGVQAFAGVEDRCRSYIVDGAPVVTGLVAIGDAWACTNPSLGRGASFGVMHARILRDVLRECASGSRPDDVVQVFHEATTIELLPLFDKTVAVTRHRLAEIEANIAGEPYQTADMGWSMGNALHAAAYRDPDLLRAYVSIAAMIATPEQVFADPGPRPAGNAAERGCTAVLPARAEPSRIACGAGRPGADLRVTSRPCRPQTGCGASTISNRTRDQVESARSRPSGVGVPAAVRLERLDQGFLDAEDAVGCQSFVATDKDVRDERPPARRGDHEMQV